MFKGDVLIQNHKNMQLEPFETTLPFNEHTLFNPFLNKLLLWKDATRMNSFESMSKVLKLRIQNMQEGVKLEVMISFGGDLNYDIIDSIIVD